MPWTGRLGYKTEDFIYYVGPFARAAHRADPNCKILGGYNIEGYHPAKGLPDTLKELERFITLGGLKDLDVFTVHVYPSLEPPEYMEQVIQRLQTVMDENGGRKPIWFTEYGYYGDDDPWCVPIVVHFNGARLPSERVQAEYQVRFNTVLLANGVEKIFSHAGTGSAINHTNFWTMFLRYDSEPFKCYASQAVMAQLLTPSCKFVKRLLPEMPVKAYLFRDEEADRGGDLGAGRREVEAGSTGQPEAATVGHHGASDRRSSLHAQCRAGVRRWRGRVGGRVGEGREARRDTAPRKGQVPVFGQPLI